jgi:hypothetical protein
MLAVAAIAALIQLTASPKRSEAGVSERKEIQNPVPLPYHPPAEPGADREVFEAPVISYKPKPKPVATNRSRENGASRKRNSVLPREIATSFIPLSGNALIPLDGGLVVRVELPRSALMSFGLPMNMQRADERIKADILLGNDGLARAIRFVETQGVETAVYR